MGINFWGKHLSAYLTAAALAPALYAGQVVKNGGAIVDGTCYRDNSGNPVAATEVLDFYEGTVLRGWHYQLGAPDASVESKIELMLRRLERVDPDRTADVRAWLASFDRERAWLTNGATLPSVDDIGAIEGVLPRGCEVRQAAGQRIPDYPPFDPYYIFDRALWDRLNNDSRAGLVIHELIYRDGVRRGHTTSEATRFLTGLLATDLIDTGTVTQQDYDRVIFRSKFDSYAHGELRFYPQHTFTNGDEAAAFCRNLSSNSHIAWISQDRIVGEVTGWTSVIAHGANTAIERYLMALPEDSRVFRVDLYVNVGMAHRWTTIDFRRVEGDEGKPAAPICWVAADAG